MENNIIKFLVIDDIQDNLVTLTALIKDIFPEAIIITAINGKKGLELALNEDPDVILLDIIMPEMDGYTVCQKLKADAKLRDIPVIFVTALNDPRESRLRALECGGEAFLSKPIDEIELTAQIHSMLKIRKANIKNREEKEKLAELVDKKTKELSKTYLSTLNLLEDLKTENESRIKSEERFRSLLRNLETGIVVHAPDTSIVLSNLRACELLGLTNDQLSGKTSIYQAWNFITEDYKRLPFEEYPVNRIITSKQSINNQIFGISRQNINDTVWVKVDGLPVFDNNGDISEIVISFVDITDRKESEVSRTLGMEILKKLNDNNTMNSSIQQVLVLLKTYTDTDAIGIRIQEGEDFPYYEQSGFPEDFLLTENSLIIRNADGSTCRNTDGTACLACTCGLVISGTADLTNPLFSKGGSFWTNNSLPILDIPLPDDPRHNPRTTCIQKGYASIALVPIKTDNKIIGLIQVNDKRKGQLTLKKIEFIETIASHIGSFIIRKKTEKNLQKYTTKLEQSNKELADFVYIASHDLKEPLRGISNCASFIQMDHPKLEEIIKKELNHIIELAERLDIFINELLAFSKIGNTDIPFADCLIKEIVEDSIENIRSCGFYTNAEIIIKDFPDTAILCNRERLKYVYQNLITNGLKYNTKTHKRIEIGSFYENNQNVYYVYDNGIGIEETHHEIIFQIFKRLHPKDEFTGGTGVGLAIVKKVILQHHGDIWLKSMPNQGTTFYFTLNINKDEQEKT